jgi:cell division protein FtsQ
MQRAEQYISTPDTRARVAARRRSRRTRKQARPARARETRTARTARLEHERTQAHRQRGSARAYPDSRLGTRRHVKAWLSASSRVLRRGSSLARQRAERARTRRPGSGSQVRPGPRQAALDLLQSGRIFSLALFVASMLCLIYLFSSPELNIHQIDVTGNSVLARDNIVELSGMRGVPIWFLDKERVGERLLSNAYIEQASIEVAFPNRATIQVVERRPEVRWQMGHMQYIVDAGGTVLGVADAPPEPDTLVIVASLPDQPDPSTALNPMDHVDPDALRLAQTLALRLPTELGLTPDTIGWDYGLGVYILTDSAQMIIFGRTDELERKLAVLRQLLADETPFTYLDLRPSTPFYKAEG